MKPVPLFGMFPDKLFQSICEGFRYGPDGILFVLEIGRKDRFGELEMVTPFFIAPDIERDDWGIILQGENGRGFYGKRVTTEEGDVNSIASWVGNLVYRNNEIAPFS